MSIVVVAVAAGVLYARGVARHPRRWPAARTAAMAGAVAAGSASAVVGDGSFTRHMTEHLLLGMVAPFLVALAAPTTLVLQTGGPATRRLLRRALRSPAGRWLGRPVVGFCLFGAGLVVVYLTPVLELSASNRWVHLAVHAHLVASGLVFLVPLVGADVLPRPVPFGARLLAVVLAVPFHAFLGLAIASAGSPLAPDAYPSLDDQRSAAGFMWAAGELLSLAVAAAVFVRWREAEAREGARYRPPPCPS